MTFFLRKIFSHYLELQPFIVFDRERSALKYKILILRTPNWLNCGYIVVDQFFLAVYFLKAAITSLE